MIDRSLDLYCSCQQHDKFFFKSVTYGRFDTIFLFWRICGKKLRFDQCLQGVCDFSKFAFLERRKKTFFVMTEKAQFSADGFEKDL